MTEQPYPMETINVFKQPKTASRLLKAWNPKKNAPKVGTSATHFAKSFLEKPDRDAGQSSLTRLRRIFDALYHVAIDTTNKQCVSAANILLTRAYGQVPVEMDKEQALILALENMPEEAKSFIAGLILPNQEQIGIVPEALESDEDAEDNTLEGVEYAKFEDIPANGKETSQTPR